VGVFGLYLRSGRKLTEDKKRFLHSLKSLRVIKVKLNQLRRRQLT
jgi:hypothetical protein